MSHENKQTIKEVFNKNWLQLSVQFFGLLFVVINLWLSGQLAPLVKGIDLLNQRVVAIEKLETQHIDSKEFDIISRKIDEIGARLDRLIERTR